MQVAEFFDKLIYDAALGEAEVRKSCVDLGRRHLKYLDEDRFRMIHWNSFARTLTSLIRSHLIVVNTNGFCLSLAEFCKLALFRNLHLIFTTYERRT